MLYKLWDSDCFDKYLFADGTFMRRYEPKRHPPCTSDLDWQQGGLRSQQGGLTVASLQLIHLMLLNNNIKCYL